jgi:thymidylate synthase
MMREIRGRSANELFIKIAGELIDHGETIAPRGLKTRELRDVMLTLDIPRDAICTLDERGLDMDYLEGELEWYKSGSLDVKDIAKHSKFWNKIQNEDGTVNSNYGHFVYHQLVNGQSQSQFDWCMDQIKADPRTRQAVINYNQPMHKFEGNKDFVCTIAQMFRVRFEEGDLIHHPKRLHLDSTVIMRSNDLIYGLSYDLPWFTGVQRDMADKLKMFPGRYHHFAASLHVYEKHFDMLENIANAEHKTLKT